MFHLPLQTHLPTFLELRYQFFLRAVFRRLSIFSIKKTKLISNKKLVKKVSINVRVIVTTFIKILRSKTLNGEISFREI